MLEFLCVLFYDRKLAYRTVNVARSAISAVALIDGQPVGQHRRVKQFFRAAHIARPPMPRFCELWDPDVVLSYISRLGENVSLPLLTLSKKLTFLFMLLSGQRFQTLSYFDIRNMTLSPTMVSFRVGDLLKTSCPQFHLSEVSFRDFPSDRNLCVVSALQAYLAATRPVRGNVTVLLLSSQAPHGPASRSTLSRWTREIMANAGIDVSLYHAYSVKHAGVSTGALFAPIPVILAAAGWRRESTFRVHYQFPVSTRGDFGAAVLSGRL